MPKVIKINDLSQNELRYKVDFLYVVRYSWIQLFNLVQFHGYGQAQLDMTEVIPNQHETLCAIWYHFYNLKNVRNTHGGVLLLVKS